MREQIEALEQKLSAPQEKVTAIKPDIIAAKPSAAQLDKADPVEMGMLGASYGKLGGRPRTLVDDDEGRKKIVSSVFPQRHEPKLADLVKTIHFFSEKIEENGGDKNEDRQPQEFWSMLRKKYYPHLLQNRKLMDIWANRHATEKRWDEHKHRLGKEGGLLAQGKRTRATFHQSMATVRFGKVRQSALAPILSTIQLWFERQRSVGNYVDNADLFAQFEYEAEKVGEGIGKMQDLGEKVPFESYRLKRAIENRLDGIARNAKNKEKLTVLLHRTIGCKLLKPQRLIALSLEEEKARAWLSWRMYDYCLRPTPPLPH